MNNRQTFSNRFPVVGSLMFAALVAAGPARAEEAAAPEAVPPAENAAPAQTPPPAKTGHIVGRVTDGVASEGLIEAQVTVVELGKKVLTDLDGNFSVEVPPGTYHLRVWIELFPARRVGPVEVRAGHEERADVVLTVAAESQIAVQEVVVVAAPDKSTEAVQVVRRQQAVAASDGISAEQLSRTADGNASEAVKRVVATSLVDNKFVFIRGLGGRYASALLNGAPAPNPDPDAPSPPLDLFPTGLLANLTVAKTYTPDLPGNFAGGALNLETREFPTKRTLKLKLNGGGDSVTTGQPTLDYAGSGTDFLGFDDGTRALPGLIPTDGPLTTRPGVSQADIDAAAATFRNVWSAQRSAAAPNLGFSASLGDSFGTGFGKVGYFASANYGKKRTRRLTDVRRTDNTGVNVVEERRVQSGSDSVGLGGLVDVGWQPSSDHQLHVVSLYSHHGEDRAELTRYTPEGQADSTSLERTSLRFRERALWFGQLLGEHRLTGDGTSLSWQANLATTSQEEPDTRDTSYVSALGATPTIATSGAGSADRYFADLADLSGGGNASVVVPLPWFKLKTGAALHHTGRNFSSRRFRFSVLDPNLEASRPETIFASENFGSGATAEEVTRFTDGYRGQRTVAAGFVMAEVAALDSLRVVGGARYELAAQRIDIGTPFAAADSRNQVARQDHDVLPALTAIWQASEALQLRSAYSLTVARPSLRELAPVLYYDYGRGRSVSGNPELLSTSIHAVDARLEGFFGGTDLAAITIFGKLFDDPIEATFKDQTGTVVSYVNTPSAVAAGVELEGRVSLGRLSPVLAPYFVAANVAFMWSQIALDAGAERSSIEGTNRDRPLQGQSPYLGNVEFGARFESTGTSASVLYNVAGPRISEVGIAGAPDAYEMPVHRLDLTVSQELGAGFDLKLTASNVLNQRVRFQRKHTEVLGYDPGVAFSASLEWALDS